MLFREPKLLLFPCMMDAEVTGTHNDPRHLFAPVFFTNGHHAGRRSESPIHRPPPDL